MFFERSSEKELIDLGSAYYTPQEYEDCLNKLDKIGQYLGGDQATFSTFEKLLTPPQSILDVGCGGGHFTRRLAERYPQAQVVGIDINEEAIRLAQRQKRPNLEFRVNEMQYPPKSFDVVTSTLVCHHLSDKELVAFLKKGYEIAKQAVIINDLHRHFLASFCFRLIAPIFFDNRLVMHDGLISIRRAFVREDWCKYLLAAEIPLENCSLTWHWAFRWVLKVDTR